MWVEFVGLPGAGKSTISRALAVAMDESGYECLLNPGFAHIGRPSKGRLMPALSDLVRAIEITYRCRRLWGHLLPHVHQRHLLPRYWRLVRTWAGLDRITQLNREDGIGRIVILDQGILQCLRSVYPTRVGQAGERRLTRLGIEGVRSVLPDLAVVVSVDESTAASRMRSRPPQRTSFDLDDPKLEAALTPHRRYVEELLPEALQGESTSVLRLSGHVGPTENAARVMEAFSRIAATR